jgi:hypothetical protein
MGQVIQLHRTTASQRRGAALATACMANRYRLTPEQSTRLALEAAALVDTGHTAGGARSKMLKKAQHIARLSPPEAA